MAETLTLDDLTRVESIGEDEARLAELRGRSWAVRSARGVEVLRFRPGVAMLEHKQMEKGTSFQRRLDDIGIVDGPARANWDRMLVTTEGERRRRLRLPFISLLRGPHLRALDTQIREIVAGILDEISDPSDVDLMEEIAWKVPSRVYCHLVAAPMEHAPLVARLSDSTLAPILTGDRSRRQETIDAFETTRDFVSRHLGERRRAGLGDDFASMMIRQQMEGLQTEEELVFEGIALLQASVDNTVHQIGLALGALLEEPSRWQAIVADESLLEQGAEEAMRLQPRFGTVFRHAPEETLLEDLAIPAGVWVFLSIRSANRDETMFEEPSRFRFDRNLKRALEFGGGPYSCLGQTLARMEIHAVVRALRERFPGARLAGQWSRHVTNAVTEVAHLRARLA